MVAHSLQQEVNLSRRACRISQKKEEEDAEEVVEEQLLNGANQSPASEVIAFLLESVSSESSSRCVDEDPLSSRNCRNVCRDSSGQDADSAGKSVVRFSCDLVARVFLLVKAIVMGVWRFNLTSSSSSSSSHGNRFSTNLVKWCTWAIVLSVLLANHGGFVLARPKNGVVTADGTDAVSAVSSNLFFV